MMLLTISMALSLASLKVIHPLSFMFLIILQTLTTCLSSSSFLSNAWFAFILFMIFLGGVMVLFIYMSSLASNENFKFPSKLMTTLFLGIATLMSIMMYMFPHLTTISVSLNPLNPLLLFYSMKFSPLMFSLILYLLFTLLVISFLIKMNKSPMRSSF